MNGEPQSPDHELLARRRLLKAAGYVPPVILGVMMARPVLAFADQPGQTKNCKLANNAGSTTIVISAFGQACCPCVPESKHYDPNRCLKTKCELGNCPACAQAVWRNSKECRKEAPPACQSMCP